MMDLQGEQIAVQPLGYKALMSDKVNERKASLVMVPAEDLTHGHCRLSLVPLTKGHEWRVLKVHRCSSAPTM